MPLRCLIVDDNAGFRDEVRVLLEEQGLVLSSSGAPEFPVGTRWPLGVPSLPASMHYTGGPARIDDFAEPLASMRPRVTPGSRPRSASGSSYTVSEALTNASKHANATRVRVSVRVEDDMLGLSIRDDGVGGADASRGSGLTGLIDRIEALGGKIQVESPPGSGTSIEIGIPILQSFDRQGSSTSGRRRRGRWQLRLSAREAAGRLRADDPASGLLSLVLVSQVGCGGALERHPDWNVLGDPGGVA